MTDDVVLRLDEVHALASAALIPTGLGADHVRSIADVTTDAERDECTSHGLFRIPAYAEGVRSGRVNPTAQPTLETVLPSILRVDAQHGYAQLALDLYLDALTEAARENGMAAMAITHCHQVAALWHEVERLASAGIVAMAMTTSRAAVAPAGGTQPVYGTDPFAFAWPRREHPPVVFDQASSASARGEIMPRERAGTELPDGWAIDRHGRPTTDPTAALDGAQLAFGGHKGASIAMMVELLAGPLIGQAMSFDSSEASTARGPLSLAGGFIVAFDPTALSPHDDPAVQADHAERLFARILEQDGTRLPSDRRVAARERTTTHGVTTSRTLYEARAQAAVATSSLNFSDGVIQPSVSRGRSLSSAAMASS